MAGPETLRLLPGVRLASNGSGWALVTPLGQIPVMQPSEGVLGALSRLASTWVDGDELFDAVEVGDGFEMVPQFSLLLDRLAAGGVLQSAVGTTGSCWAEFTPAILGDAVQSLELPSDRRLRLSPHALLRSDDVGAICETALSRQRVVLRTPAAVSLVASFAFDAEVGAVCEGIAEPERDVALALIMRLLAAGVLHAVESEADPAPHPGGDVEWEFHDLLFHARTRLGRHTGGYGGTFRRGSGRPVPPAIKERMSEAVIPLAREDLERARATDPSFVEVMETRRSSSSLGIALSVEDLGRFLHRAARVIALRETAEGAVTTRPYPAAGGIYELELYPLVSTCRGLGAGLYQYRPQAHELCRLTELTPTLAWMLEFARASLRAEACPPVLIVMAARFERMFAKYDSIAYALILKDVGVLMQTMSLVATALGLACCPIGGGSADAFASASGLAYMREGAVGEFALGSRATDRDRAREADASGVDAAAGKGGACAS